MKLRNRTILITGGSSGIGLQLAKALITQQNTVIICGRSESKLNEAKSQLPGVEIVSCDIGLAAGREQLIKILKDRFPACSVLINNAAIVHKTNFLSDDAMIEKTEAEVRTNLIAPIVLSKLFLHHVQGLSESAIINITTGLVYAPRAVYPIYNSTKAALHTFTQVLRHQLKKEKTRIIEVMMPVVDTPWHKGEVPSIAISPEKAVTEMILKIENGGQEIRVGAVSKLYFLFRISPRLAFRVINNIDNKK
jgi:uncharacterized oxidoreductase